MVRLAMYEKNVKAQAILESDKIDELEDLITDFMSDSSDTRSDAKSIFEICTNKPNPHLFAKKLCDVLSSHLDLKSRTISAILLRKSLINKFDSPFLRFPPDTQSTLKLDLLKLVDTQPINKELCHTVSALVVSLLPTKRWPEFKWPEFLSFLCKLVTSDKKRAWLIGAHLAQYLGKRLKELYSVKLDKELHSVNLDMELHSVLLQCLTEGEGEDVRIAVWGAAINFILCLEQKDLVNFQDLLTAMKSTLKKALYSGNETMADAVNTLKLLINLAGMKPTFLREQIVEMVKTILPMAYENSLAKGTRRLAIEFVLTLDQFVLTLAEVEKTNPRQLKLGMEFEINMEEMWDDNEEMGNYGSWQGCVNRLWFLSFRNDILTVAREVLPAYVAAPKGHKRHAALIALSQSIIKWKCQECLLKEGEWDVRVEALGAAINIFPCPNLLTSMLSMLEDRDEAMAGEVLELLIKLAEPRFLVGQIEEWAERMWQIANRDGLNVGTRRLAFEVLSKLAQAEEIAPWMQQNVRKLFEFLMNTLDHINDDDPNADYVYAWHRSNHWNWETWLDRLFIAVIRNDMLSIVLKVLQAYLEAPGWQKKYSAFIVLTRSIKSWRTKQVTIENLEQVVPMVLSPFPNTHRHVRCAAIKAIQQLLEHLLHFRLHEEVMRTNFELVMSTLLNSFQDDNPVVQNASIRATQWLAWTFGKHLQVVSHLVLPALAEVMNDSPNQEMRVIAASIILDFSEYCTPENLKEHLDKNISSCLIVSKEVKEFDHRSRRLSRLSKAWAQLWRNEGRDFSSYLETLMYPVFDSAAAQLDPDRHRYDRVNIIEEKAKACHVLCFCVDELGELLVPLIGRVVRTLIPFLKWYHDPPVLPSPKCYYAKAIRIAAVSAMPKILNSAREVVKNSDPEDYDHAMQYVEELSDKVKRALNESSDVEPDEDVRYDILYALEDCEQ